MIEIVTDSGCDLHESQFAGLPVTFVPLNVSIGDESFDRDNPISPVEFYRRLSETLQFPKTSQAAIGNFVETYRTIAARGSEILSIHIAGALSGTIRAARAAAALVPEAKVTFFDSRTLTSGLGWQVQAAGQAILRNWGIDQILSRLELIRDQVDGQFTLNKYLAKTGSCFSVTLPAFLIFKIL